MEEHISSFDTNCINKKGIFFLFLILCDLYDLFGAHFCEYIKRERERESFIYLALTVIMYEIFKNVHTLHF